MTPDLMDDIIEEILVRVLPDDPARLVRAALVCRRWRNVVADPGFRRRFGKFHHGAPPMLGFFGHPSVFTMSFVPTSSFHPPDACCGNLHPVDARHGRVLFFGNIYTESTTKWGLVVSNPITTVVHRLTLPPSLQSCRFRTAALCCAEAGCDHVDCYDGPFSVVAVGTTKSGRFAFIYVYSSGSDTWKRTASVACPKNFAAAHHVLVGTAVYFLLEHNTGILEFDIAKHEQSVISLPSMCRIFSVVLMTPEDGTGLRFAIMMDLKLFIWSRKHGSNQWESSGGVVDLKNLLPVCVRSRAKRMRGYADGASIFFIEISDAGVFAIDLKSRRATKVFDNYISRTVPYMTFCTPRISSCGTPHR